MITLAPSQQQVRHEQPTTLPAPSQPQRVKCGEVYTWDCAGELYGVECILCEERPLCTLAEFAEHMDIWHYCWTQTPPAAQQSAQKSHTPTPPASAEQKQYCAEAPCAHAQMSMWPTATTAASTLSSSTVTTDSDGVVVAEESGSVVVPTVQRIANDIRADDAKIVTSIAMEPQEPCEQVLIAAEVTAKSNGATLDVLTSKAVVAADGNDVPTELPDEVVSVIGVETKNHTATLGATDVINTHNGVQESGLSLASKLEQSISNYRQNVKLIEIYEQFPVLWHREQRDLITPERRVAAFRSISASLKIYSINLSALAVQRRVYWLRKRYRLEKFHDLSNQLRRLPFVASFKYYALMQFLDEHIEPHVCEHCGKIYKGDICACDGEVVQEVLNDDEKQKLKPCTSNVPLAEVRGNIEAQELELANKQCTIMADSSAVEVNADIRQLNGVCEAQIADQSVSSDLEQVPKSNGHTLEMTTIEKSDIPCTPGNDSLKLDTSTPSLDVEDSFSVPTDVEDNDELHEQTFARLTLDQTHKLIALYQEYPQLWDPNHVDFNCRKLRRTAWRMLTARFNKRYGIYYAWTTVHRKLSDYVKYYKREKQRIETQHSCTKWCFYDEFAFMDVVLHRPAAEVQQKTLTKQQNLQIIEAYRAQQQLWNTKHADFRRRTERHAQIVAMCAQLKSEFGICITPEKLKQRFIDFRCSYRVEKAQRIGAMERNEPHTPQYEFYTALQFLDAHVAPFVCEQCGTQYKRHTDFLLHMRKQHPPANGRKRRRRCNNAITAALALCDEIAAKDTQEQQDAQDASVSSTSNNGAKKAAELENVCHICGINFTLRRNLVYHLNRHLNRRTHACTMCPKTFFNSSSLRVHERTHTKCKPFICEYCGVGYINGSKLNQHMKRHRNQRDHACSQCNKKFYTAFERDRHMRGHQKVREKTCPVCGKEFGAGSAYYAHMLLHSDVKRYSCKPCGREFAQYAGLYKHRKRFHPSEATEAAISKQQ